MDRTREAAGIGIAGLDRLTEAEREALHLLAEGHTAKSIAALTGRSVAAVNERLRDARRKTGASSSRELARLLKAEKAGDEKIGIAAPAVAGAGPEPGSAPAVAARMRKAMVMGTILAVAAAAALYIGQGNAPEASAPVAKGDPLLGTMFQGPDIEPRRLYAQLRSEARDEAWAPHAEAALKAYYRRLPHAAGIGNLRILCASTLCEVAGGISEGKPTEINAVMRELQDQKLTQSLRQAGLKFSTASFGSSKHDMVFAIYWERDRS